MKKEVESLLRFAASVPHLYCRDHWAMRPVLEGEARRYVECDPLDPEAKVWCPSSIIWVAAFRLGLSPEIADEALDQVIEEVRSSGLLHADETASEVILSGWVDGIPWERWSHTVVETLSLVADRVGRPIDQVVLRPRTDFETYEEAVAYAWSQEGPHGIERVEVGLPGWGPWIVRPVPRDHRLRAGWEVRCEVVNDVEPVGLPPWISKGARLGIRYVGETR